MAKGIEYGYRWVMLVGAANQLLWISFAPITGTAAQFYGVSDLAIGLLSMIFMIVFIIASIPASWVIDTYGIRVGVGIAVGQPFVLNAVAKIAGRWFPINERATAA